jgi:adenylate cyclase
VRQGDFTVRVPVYDGTQIGQLQHGFNEMVGGLSERERIRDLFGAYVDRDVAEHLLTEGTSVSGERVLVTVMFIDVRGFTSFTERHAPEEVLAALNRLFQIAVKVIHAHGGRVDKFVGDGLLAVFGAPRRLEDHAEQALAAAREIAEATAANGELEIGVGLDSGEVLAGNVGGAGRLEFTVIGDTVNVAARVEAATRQTGDVILLTDRTHTLLDPRTATGLDEREPMELRGKQERVRVYATRVSARPSPARPPSPGTAR